MVCMVHWCQFLLIHSNPIVNPQVGCLHLTVNSQWESYYFTPTAWNVVRCVEKKLFSSYLWYNPCYFVEIAIVMYHIIIILHSACCILMYNSIIFTSKPTRRGWFAYTQTIYGLGFTSQAALNKKYTLRPTTTEGCCGPCINKQTNPFGVGLLTYLRTDPLRGQST